MMNGGRQQMDEAECARKQEIRNRVKDLEKDMYHLERCCRTRADLVFLQVKAGMTVIVANGSDWRMADVIWVDGGARNPKVPTLFQVVDVDKGDITWVSADLVTHIVPRV